MKKKHMSMEEYMRKRKQIKEEEKSKKECKDEKSPAWVLAELIG